MDWLTITAIAAIVIGNGFALWAIDRFREARRYRKEYCAAIRVVRDELRHDYGACSAMCQLNTMTDGIITFTPAVSASAFSGEAYLSVRFRLATYLPQAIRAQLAALYARAPNMAEAASNQAGAALAPTYGDQARMLDFLLGQELKRSTHWALRRWLTTAIHPLTYIRTKREPEWPELPILSQRDVPQ